ncbi:uncharacterized protein NDAI_0F00870 [Naumovozyma dairenensis CBS 421]|uniref:Uncharacterized protein n=1 Tax=Naumovozyma dairenensis (strain ATCC 10597 / BCRC 20456 / CBS 421 / NBRC 0211 / NRRL Y-12639) TaxID=1071378 RepID=G0WC95_NAUDC|nr:hypothetical protein NDAI_0F00870 [Naumovozyma dairenensis CBS 421]CCD25406.1 hypothetical protein NDAI_0F00870 [Naumovozyma dairenensis CBS 421]
MIKKVLQHIEHSHGRYASNLHYGTNIVNNNKLGVAFSPNKLAFDIVSKFPRLDFSNLLRWLVNTKKEIHAENLQLSQFR